MSGRAVARRRARQEACVYCGAPATTRDHVVPRGLFAAVPPEGYITVPACLDCNNSHSRDEEYLVMVLGAEGSLYSEIPNGVLARWDADHRSGKRSRTGLARRLLESLESVEMRSASGLYLGAGKRFTLDVPRVNRVLTKIVKGLFFHELGRRLPGDARVYVEIKPDVAVLEREPFGLVRSEQASTPRKLGGVLTYRYFAFPDCVEASLWLLAFYGGILAVAATAPAEPGHGPLES